MEAGCPFPWLNLRRLAASAVAADPVAGEVPRTLRMIVPSRSSLAVEHPELAEHSSEVEEPVRLPVVEEQLQEAQHPGAAGAPERELAIPIELHPSTIASTLVESLTMTILQFLAVEERRTLG